MAGKYQKKLCMNCRAYSHVTDVDGKLMCHECYIGHYPPCSVCGKNVHADNANAHYLDNADLYICDECDREQQQYREICERDMKRSGDK